MNSKTIVMTLISILLSACASQQPYGFGNQYGYNYGNYGFGNQNYSTNNALIGGGVGAVAGAALGTAFGGNDLANAGLGALAGGAVGAAVGAYVDQQQDREREQSGWQQNPNYNGYDQ